MYTPTHTHTRERNIMSVRHVSYVKKSLRVSNGFDWCTTRHFVRSLKFRNFSISGRQEFEKREPW